MFVLELIYNTVILNKLGISLYKLNNVLLMIYYNMTILLS